jgi:hypothetical protein
MSDPHLKNLLLGLILVNLILYFSLFSFVLVFVLFVILSCIYQFRNHRDTQDNHNEPKQLRYLHQL